MKAITFAIAAVLAAAGAANAQFPTEEITFRYDLDRSRLATDAGARAVYADLELKARTACTLPGVRGLKALDEACVADLVNKVVALTGSAALESQFAGSSLAMLVREENEQLASIR